MKMSVSSYIQQLPLEGRYWFTTEEIAENLQIRRNSVSVALSRLASKGRIKMIRQGFGVVTALTRGTLHPSYFIDSMMRHLDAPYYVGLLSAASHWGASHQAAMKYYVIVDKVIRPIELGRLEIIFLHKTHLSSAMGIQRVSSHGGFFNISSPELTAVDLFRFPRKSGHLNHVATVLEELFEKIKPDQLVAICAHSQTPTTTIQRLGYALDQVLQKKQTADAVYKALLERSPQRILLKPTSKGETKYSSYPFDKKWSLYLNTQMELEE